MKNTDAGPQWHSVVTHVTHVEVKKALNNLDHRTNLQLCL
jgi:hypothetical protein